MPLWYNIIIKNLYVQVLIQLQSYIHKFITKQLEHNILFVLHGVQLFCFESCVVDYEFPNKGIHQLVTMTIAQIDSECIAAKCKKDKNLCTTSMNDKVDQ